MRVLSDFAGRWTLSRQILHADAPDAQFDGVAEWASHGQELIYHEQGTLCLPGHAPMKSERRYLWRAPLDVFFDDGRFFHAVPPEGGESYHFCDPDAYTAIYDFSAWPASFDTTWRVRGPRKNYTMKSLYTR